MTHDLKTLPEHFQAVWDGRKTAELRRDDRGYALGDYLRLQEWKPSTGYTGREVEARITHILTQNPLLLEGYAMLSFDYRILRRTPSRKEHQS